MKHRNYIVLSLFISSLLLTQCKDEIPALEYKQQGFIKGTITGTWQDGKSPINENFNNTQYAPALYGDYSYYRAYPSGEVIIYFERTNVATGDDSYFEIYMEDIASAEPDYVDFSIWHIKSADSGLFFRLNAENEEVTLTNFSFDITTGRLKSEFVVEALDNNGSEATVVGSVDVILKETNRNFLE